MLRTRCPACCKWRDNDAPSVRLIDTLMVESLTAQNQPLVGATTMRVLIVVTSLAPEAGGTSATAVDLAETLRDLGHSVAIWTTELEVFGGSLSGERVRREKRRMIPGVDVRYFDVQRPARLAFSPALTAALAKEATNFDVAYLYSMYLHSAWGVALVLRRCQVPYIAFIHGSLYPFLRRKGRLRKGMSWYLFDRRYLKGAAAVHYASRGEYEVSKPKVPMTPGVIIPHSVDPEPTQGLPRHGCFRELHPELFDDFLFVFVGRLAPQKGVDVLIDAFAMVNSETPNTRLILAGPDQGEGETLHRLAIRAGIADRVHFMGLVTGRDKLALLRDAGAWVCMSRADNFGMAAVEAMAAGVPVVLSANMGIHREVADSGAGFIVGLDRRAAAEAMRELALNAALRQDMGARGRRLVSQAYARDVVGRRMEQFFYDVARRKRIQDCATYESRR